MMTEQVQEIPQPAQPVPIEPKKKSNLSLIVILVIAILLVGVGGVYAGMQLNKKQLPPKVVPQPIVPTSTPMPYPIEITQTPASDKTSNWKTYTDKENSFLFKYPSDWVFKEYPPTDNDPKIIAVTSNVQGSADTSALGKEIKYMYGVSVMDYKIPTGEDPEAYIKNKRMNGASIEEKMVGSYKVFINPESPSMRGAYAVYFERPNKTSYVEFIFDPYYQKEPYPHQNELFSVFDQILSTFKFTN